MRKTRQLENRFLRILEANALNKIIVFNLILIFIASLSVSSIFAATVSHAAEQVRAGIFGNNYTGNWSFMNGSVGIGTTTPAATLQVNSSNATGAFAVYNASGPGTYLFVNGSSGKVGIGTTDPDYELHVDTGTNGYIGIEYDTNQYGGIAFHENGVASGYIQLNDVPTTDRLEFFVGGGADADRKMVIQDGGNVGIGTTSPGQSLQIGDGTSFANLTIPKGAICLDDDGTCTTFTAGQGRADSWITTGGDVAEYVPVNPASKLETGDVIAIDETGSFALSTKPYGTNVAGIVSKNAGVILGLDDNENSKKALLALAGRVPVKATAENGAIKPGDLLTTSSIPGYAMKCNDKIKCIGAIVGKALEPLEKGTGTIIALVTLQ